MLISVTRPLEEHDMKVHLHGVVEESLMTQFEKEGEESGGEFCELWSHEKRSEASWFAETGKGM